MKPRISDLIQLTSVFLFLNFAVYAHPGSGIIVDEHGQVFFQDSAARTIWKIDAQGNVTAHYDKMGGHWMISDSNGRFAHSDLKLLERITFPGRGDPALIVADGGAPIAIGTDGNLYYGINVISNKVTVGITTISPDGQQKMFAPEFAKYIENLGITGLTRAADGGLYVACLNALVKLKTDGTFVILANPVTAKDCDRDAPTMFLRGLDADSRGNIYVAACGCRCVLKIFPNGENETILKAESPWSPTGVAIRDGQIYVLEYTNANGSLKEGWLPRVRKIDRNGRVVTLATITQDQQNRQPHRQIIEPNRR